MLALMQRAFFLVAQARRAEAALWPRRQATPPVGTATLPRGIVDYAYDVVTGNLPFTNAISPTKKAKEKRIC